MLTFDEATHTYKINGEPVPSVTQIIGHYLNPYGAVPAATLQHAAAFGKHVHSMCAMYLQGTLDEAALDSGLVPYLDGFKKWCDKCNMKKGVLEIEKPLCSTRLKFAGTPDIILVGQEIIDIKTRLYSKTTDPLQLAAYDKLHGGTGSSLDHYCLEIMPDDYKLTKCNDKNAWPVFKQMLDHFHATKKLETTLTGWRQR